MTTAGQDAPLTAADLLFGPSADAPEALTRHLISDGRSLGRALALAGRQLRKRGPRSHPPLAPPSDVRAVPDQGRPGPVTIHEIGMDETYTVRLEPLPAAIITTIEETRS